MRTFIQIWAGQLVSTIGSYMTFFALSLWAWETTGSATALALVGFFVQLPQIPATLLAGAIVDRFNRKHLMLLGDAVTACATLTIGLLHLTGRLEIWHLYPVAAVAGIFGQIQILAYQASMSLIVPKKHYTRASSLGSAVHYSSNIVSPALAGILYPIIGLSGIVGIDAVTFAIAFITLLTAPIPQPSGKTASPSDKLIDNLAFGFRQVWRRPELRTLLLFAAMFSFAHDLGGSLHSPMILARTDGNARILASVSAAAGIGGVMGSAIASIWGGPKSRVRGMLVGIIGAGLSKIVFGFGRSLSVWMPAQICSSLNFPLLGSCRSALWMEAIPPERQGRVFAANSVVIKSISALAVLLAGPLADRILEPAMMPEKPLANLLGFAFGNGPGAGMAVIYVACSACLFLIGLTGFFVPQLRAIETKKSPS